MNNLGMTPSDITDPQNVVQLQIARALSGVSCAMPVKVVAVNSVNKTVDIHILVTLSNADGVSIPHKTIYACPYCTVASGTSAILLTPTVGDVGLAVFADRDISGVVRLAGAKDAPAASTRTHDYADAIYIGALGFGIAAATQFISFTPTGIEIVAPSVKINGIDFATHYHYVAAAPGNSGPAL